MPFFLQLKDKYIDLFEEKDKYIDFLKDKYIDVPLLFDRSISLGVKEKIIDTFNFHLTLILFC